MYHGYTLHLTIHRTPPSQPRLSEGEVLARALKVIAGNMEARKSGALDKVLVGELFDFRDAYGHWRLERE